MITKAADASSHRSPSPREAIIVTDQEFEAAVLF
jgi:hypothetical protein